MAWYILTWNPDVWTDLNDRDWDSFAVTRKPDLSTMTWSTGGRKQGTRAGDRMIFLRQGARGRGILAIGEAIDGVFQDTHYNDPQKQANYVEVRWTSARRVADRVPTEVLIDRVPEVAWDNLMGSGVQLPDSAVKVIQELWGDPGAGSQGMEAANIDVLFERLVTHTEGKSTVRSRDLAYLEMLLARSGRTNLVVPFLSGCAASGCRIKVVSQEVTIFQDGFKAFYARGNRDKGTLDLHFHERDPRFARLRAAFPTEELVRGYWGVNLESPAAIERCFGELTPQLAAISGEPAAQFAPASDTESEERTVVEPFLDSDWDEVDEVFTEGAREWRLHLATERDRKLVALAKARWARSKEGLQCEVCCFSFAKAYGSLGEGYIEAHHRVPLAELKGPTETRIEDLAPVCANCHRMLHREPNLTIEGLQRRKVAHSLAELGLYS